MNKHCMADVIILNEFNQHIIDLNVLAISWIIAEYLKFNSTKTRREFVEIDLSKRTLLLK